MREKWLDSLKGIACVVVFLDHFYLTFCGRLNGLNKVLDVKPFRILINGNYAVCLFLMISAYIIGMQVYKSKTVKQIQKIAFKRYIRLMPPVFIISLFSLLIDRTIGYSNVRAAELMNNKWLSGFFTQKLTFPKLIQSSFINVWWKGDGTFNGPFWMLSVMFLGTYLVIILAVITTEKQQGIKLLLLAAGVYLVLNEVYSCCMVLGVILANIRYYKDLWKRWEHCRSCVMISICLFVIALYLPAYQKTIVSVLYKYSFIPDFLKNRSFYNSISSFFLLFSIIGIRPIKNMLDNNVWLEKISKISFSIYLIHWPIICSFSCWAYINFWNESYNHGVFIFCLFISTTAIVIVLSKLFYLLIEKRICNYITNKVCERYFDD